MFFHPVLGPDGLRHGVTGTVELCMAATAGDQTQWSISSRLHLKLFFQHTETAKKSEKKHHVAETA